ncbi:MAG: FRG domain-containing protein [Niastella sp.]|nr:FRG domain-containing protein [Niastella sp.]
MFDKHNPASNIFELLHYLEDQGTYGSLFRGQPRDHGTILPSGFRPYLDIIEKDKMNLNHRPIPAGQTLQAKKAIVHEKLIRKFERTIGNLMAQQYGLSSDMVDVINDLAVAAFFATRKYPNYEPIVQDELGQGEPGKYREKRIKVIIVIPKLTKGYPQHDTIECLFGGSCL